MSLIAKTAEQVWPFFFAQEQPVKNASKSPTPTPDILLARHFFSQKYILPEILDCFQIICIF